jgi:DNA-directed RNA polymerase alpha subunit
MFEIICPHCGAKAKYVHKDTAELKAKLANWDAYTPTSVLLLTARAMHCLYKMEITTVEELAKVSDKRLMSCKNLGATTLLEIKTKLMAYLRRQERKKKMQ